MLCHNLLFLKKWVNDKTFRSFRGSNKLLWSEKPVYNCFVIHLHFIQIFLFMITISTHISIISFQDFRPSRPRISTSPRNCDVNITWLIEPMKITWLIEPMKIRPSVNSSIASNRSMNCWPVNRTVLQRIGIFLLTVKMLCIYCIDFI